MCPGILDPNKYYQDIVYLVNLVSSQKKILWASRAKKASGYKREKMKMLPDFFNSNA